MSRKIAGVKERADGTLEKRFTIDGKRYSVYGKTLKELQENEQEKREKIKAGLYCSNKNITLDKYFEEWIAQRRNTIKGSTLRINKSKYKHISKHLGKRKLQQIERREIIKMRDEILKEVSVGTCNETLKLLSTILNDALREELITKNPAAKIKLVKDDKPKAAETYHRALTEEEQIAFMQELKAKESNHYEFIALQLSTGMRVGEVSALTWNDIDYKNNVIHVNKTLTIKEDGTNTIGTPKTKSSKRDIPMNDSIKNILQSQRTKQGNITPIGNNEVFLSINGNHIETQVINDEIARTVKRLNNKGMNIEHFTAHALRDTFATRFIEQGGQPQTLKTILGHASLAMTMDLYAHVLPNTKQAEMEKIIIAL